VTNWAGNINLFCLPLGNKYRSRIEIIGLILEAVKNNGANRYSLMKYTSINYAQLEKYLGALTELGFIETNLKDDQVSYRASEKGLAFLRQYYVLLGMLLSEHSPNKPVPIVCSASNGQ